MRIGFIGTGNFSKKVFETFKRNEDYTIVGGYDTPAYENLFQFEVLEDFLKQVDAIVVLDVLSSNFGLLSEIVRRGVNLYVESPSLCSKRDLRNLEMLAYESRAAIQIGLKQRFYDFYDDLEKYAITPRIIESNRFVKFNKKSTYLNAIDDLMFHDIDVTLKLAGAEVKSIYSTAVGVDNVDPDVVNTRIEFYNGCVANLSVSKIANKDKHETTFFQNNTYCSIDYLNQLLKVQKNTGETEGEEEQWGVRTTYKQSKDSDGYISMLEKEIKSFYYCITNYEDPYAGISQYLQLQAVTDKIKEQLERNFTTNV